MPASKPLPQPPRATLLRTVLELDAAASLHLYTVFHPVLPFHFLKSLELSGDGRLFFPIIISALFISYPITAVNISTTAAASRLLFNLLIGGLLDLIVIGLLKHLIQRPRPVYNKNMFLSFAVDHWSFPSGHSSRVSFIATLFFFNSDEIRQILPTILKLDPDSLFVEYFVVILGLWASITSASRVLLGRHFVLDVFAGAFLGVAEGMFVQRVLNFENLSSFFR